MLHPFEKLFEKSLSKSTDDKNYVLIEAEKLKALGYAHEEIYNVLKKMCVGRISEKEEGIILEALDEFSRYIDS